MSGDSSVKLTHDEVRALADGIIGADDFKKALGEIIDISKLYSETKNDTVRAALFSRNYLYRIGDGWGMTTGGRLITYALMAGGITDVAYVESTLEKDDKGRIVLDGPGRCFIGDETSEYRVQSIDITPVAAYTGMPGFRRIMRLFYDIDKKTLFIFRLRNASDYLFDKIYADIADIMYTEKLDFKPLRIGKRRKRLAAIPKNWNRN